jgi:hypothetical protein
VLAKHLSPILAGRVEQRRWRLLRLSRAVEGVLSMNGGRSQDLTARRSGDSRVEEEQRKEGPDS